MDNFDSGIVDTSLDIYSPSREWGCTKFYECSSFKLVLTNEVKPKSNQNYSIEIKSTVYR